MVTVKSRRGYSSFNPIGNAAFLTFCYLLAVISGPLFAQEASWELKKDSQGIQVFTRAVVGSPYKEVKSVSSISGVSLASLVAVIEDAEACPRWADKCAESYVVDRISPTESLVYTHNDMPFPVKDRDVVAKVVWSQDSETGQVTMASEAVAGGVDEVRGRLRLRQANATWQFTPLVDGSVEVSNQAHINPGSSIPGWVTNMLLVDTPFETMKSFLNEVATPRYANAEFDFIEESD